MLELLKHVPPIQQKTILMIEWQKKKYRFLTKVFPHNFGGDMYYWKNDQWHTANPSRPSHTKVILLDSPLWFHYQITNQSQLRQKQGFIWEAICKSIFKEYKNKISEILPISCQATIHDGYWEEPCTEIDLVVSDKETQTVIWGSCKLSSSHQDYFNSMSHVVSFFNNRGYERHPWYNYKHILLFLSLESTDDQRKNLIESVTAINQMLFGTRNDLVTLITNKLSNYSQGGKPFQMAGGAPQKLFSITSVSVLDFNDLLKITYTD